LASFQGEQACIYSPGGVTRALGSNLLKERRRCSLGRRWRNIPEADKRGPPPGAERHLGGVGRSYLAASLALSQGVTSWSPLESSRIVFVMVKFDSLLRFDPSFQFSD
jgi:hypothetical protein